MFDRRSSLLALAIVCCITARADAQDANERVVIDQPVKRDLYLAGGDVEVRAPVAGDLVVAGRNVRVSANVSGDAVLAGGDVVVEGAVGDDVRAAGGTVRIAGPVAGHLVAAGGTVVVEPGQRITDWAWLAGQRIEVRGDVGSLRATGNDVLIAGNVRGDAQVSGETIRLAPGTVVHGDLTWTSPRDLDVADGVIVEGRTLREAVPAADTGTTVFAVVLWLASLVFAAVLLALALPGWTATMARTARESTWRSLAVGVGVLILTPIVIALAFATGVLWIVGLLLLVSYVLALCAAGLLGVIALADLGLDIARRDRDIVSPRRARLGAVAITALVVGLIALIPVLGGLVMLLLTVIGLGASALTLRGARRRPTQVVIEGEPAPA